jgi:Rhs element Vgr protein
MPGPTNSVSIKLAGADAAKGLIDDVAEIIVDSAFSLPGSFSLTVTNNNEQHDADFSIGMEVEILFKPAFADAATSVFKGIITAIEPIFTPENTELLRVRGYEKSIKLTQGQKTRTFCQMKDSDMISRIVSNCGLSATVTATSETYPEVIQYNLTDWDFIRLRARDLGYLIWSDAGTLKIDVPPSNSSAIDVTWPDDIQRFEPRLSFLGQLAKAKATGWDPKTKAIVTGESTSKSQTYRAIGESSTGVATIASNISDKVTANAVNIPLISAAHGTKMAQARVDFADSGYVTAEGECRGDPNIAAGKWVNVIGVNDKFAGKYLVTQARHEFNSGDYITYISVNGASPETIVNLLLGEDFPVNNRIDGVVVAIVTDVNDPDNAGKVKVKYPWLLDTEGTEVASDWARVAVIGGGKDRGIGFIPEVGDEVLVAFASGDINAPYVVGNLWNGTDTAPTGMISSGKVVQRVVRSRTGHTIILDDTQGSESITIKDKTEKNSIVIKSSDNSMTISSEGDLTLSAKGKLIMKSTSDASLESSTKATIKAGTELAMTGTTKASVTGGSMSKVELQASGAKMEGAQAELSGTAQASVKGSAMVQIQGGLVKIN